MIGSVALGLLLASWSVVLKPESALCGEGKEAVRVRVVDADGRPVSKASVVLGAANPSRDYRFDALGRVAETDASGAVRWKTLPFDSSKSAIGIEVSADLMRPSVVVVESRTLCLLVVLTSAS